MSEESGTTGERQVEVVVETVEAVAQRLEAEREHLADLDSAIGDADHGGNMAKGWREAADAAADLDPESTDVAAVVKTVGKTLVGEVGGASGPLYGGSVMFASTELADGLDVDAAVAFAETYLEKVEDRGDASLGDKTMVDALTPAVHTFKKSVETDELPPLTALAKAVDAAERGVAFTVPLRAKKGRASYLGWRSVGHQDPGATSTLYILEELLDVASDHLDGDTDADAVSPTVLDTEPDESSAEPAEGNDAGAEEEGGD